MIIKKAERPRETIHNYSGGAGTLTFTALLADETLLKNEARFFKTIAFAPGAEIGEHAHTGVVAIYVVLAGNGIAIENGRELPVKRGDVMVTTDGQTHGMRDGGQGDLVILGAVLFENRAEK